MYLKYTVFPCNCRQFSRSFINVMAIIYIQLGRYIYHEFQGIDRTTIAIMVFRAHGCVLFFDNICVRLRLDNFN